MAILMPTSFADSTQNATITIGNGNLDYITFSDLTIYGRFAFAEAQTEAADFVTLERNHFKCPGDFGSGNTSSIYSANLFDSSTNVPRESLTIRNNRFIIDSTCPDYETLGNTADGPDFMHLYANKDVLIENNDFILEDPTRCDYLNDQGRPCIRYMIWTKGRAETAQIRYNYCEGEAASCVGINTGKCPDFPSYDQVYPPCGDTGPDSEGDNQAHHNVSYHSGGIGWEGHNFGQFDKIYNNTVVAPAKYACGAQKSPSSGTERGSMDFEYFNNIVVGDTTYTPDFGAGERNYIRWASHYSHNDDGICGLNYLNNNLYYPLDATKLYNFYVSSDISGSVRATTLVEWKAFLAANCTNPNTRDNASINSNPLFVNQAGKDFRLQSGSPARTGGRGVGYPSYLGAIDPVNGTTIGCTFDPACYGYTAPSVHPRTKVR
jgi:hypothetical protein